MSTIFKNDEGKVVWEHHETFTPQIGTQFEADYVLYKVKSVKLQVVSQGQGAAVVQALTSFVELE
jgi:hypothetical protein